MTTRNFHYKHLFDGSCYWVFNTTTLGKCIERVMPGDVCPLDSFASRCDEQEMRAVGCICDIGVDASLCLRMFNKLKKCVYFIILF